MAFVAAELVGSSGEIVGIDQSGESVAHANSRAREQGAANVSFTVGDIHDVAGGGPFDAIIGRLVLMYVSDPPAVLRTQANALRPGGVVAAIEFELRRRCARRRSSSASRPSSTLSRGSSPVWPCLAPGLRRLKRRKRRAYCHRRDAPARGG